MKSALSDVFFFPHRLFTDKQSKLPLIPANRIHGTENNCEMTSEPGFWFEMPLHRSLSATPSDHQLPTGTSGAACCQPAFLPLTSAAAVVLLGGVSAEVPHAVSTYASDQPLTRSQICLKPSCCWKLSRHPCSAALLLSFRGRIKPSETYSSAPKIAFTSADTKGQPYSS